MITIDTREPTRALTKLFERYHIDYRIQKLDFGDYLLTNGDRSLLVQRKTIGDFVGSYQGLKTQFAGMKAACESTALLTEGNYIVKCGRVCVWRGNVLAPTMSYQTFSSVIASMQARGSYYYHTMGMTETVLRLASLEAYLPKIGVTPDRKTTDVDGFFLGLPGMGPKSLEKLKASTRSPAEATTRMDLLPKRTREFLQSW